MNFFILFFLHTLLSRRNGTVAGGGRSTHHMWMVLQNQWGKGWSAVWGHQCLPDRKRLKTRSRGLTFRELPILLELGISTHFKHSCFYWVCLGCSYFLHSSPWDAILHLGSSADNTQCFSYCWSVLAQCQSPFFLPFCPPAQSQAGRLGMCKNVREHIAKSWPQLSRGIFHSIWHHA